MKKFISILMLWAAGLVSAMASETNITVTGTALAKLATAREVIEQLVGISIIDDQIVIDGRYIASVYIEDSPLTNVSQLKQIPAYRINTIKVIINPNAEYDKDIRAIIRVSLLAEKQNTFKMESHLQLDATHTSSLNYDQYVSWNQSRITLDAALNVRNGDAYQPSTVFIQRYNKRPADGGMVLRDRTMLSFKQETYMRSIDAMASLSYKVAEGHRLLFRYRLSVSPESSNRQVQHDRMSHFFTADESGKIDVNTPEQSIPQKAVYYIPDTKHEGNVSYNGQVNQWTLSADVKVVHDKPSSHLSIEQDGKMTYDTQFDRTGIQEESRWIATRKTKDGTFATGFSQTYNWMNVRFDNLCLSDDRIHAHIHENIAALFVQARQKWGHWGLEGGLRYEYTSYCYKAQDDDEILSQLQPTGQSSLKITKSYHRLHPNASVSRQRGKNLLTLSYAQSILTPYQGYSRVGSDYMSQPELAIIQAERQYATTLSWKYDNLLQMKLNHTYIHHPIYGTIDKFYFYNGDSYHSMDASLTASPQIGIWHPSVTASLHKQWNNMKTANGVNRLSSPLLNLQWNNIVQLPKEWTVFFNMDYHSKGATRNIRMYSCNFNSSASIQKQLWKNRLQLSLSATNLFRTNCTDITLYTRAEKGSSQGAKVYQPRTVSISAIYRLGK